MTKLEVGLDALSELNANVSVPFEQAHAMPKSVYTSQAFNDRELDGIFSRDWLCAGRSSSLSKAGDYTGRSRMCAATECRRFLRVRAMSGPLSALIMPGPTGWMVSCAVLRR